ncbi:hypothetical protein [Arsukibacterium ikkense]|uniref:hypothetical protein n=1 Tax=Arsukibacterium ikkense TaxID=336831 RepID=UPI0006271243|nr:hypothetical protein [Arsukibacterium ikkense]
MNVFFNSIVLVIAISLLTIVNSVYAYPFNNSLSVGWQSPDDPWLSSETANFRFHYPQSAAHIAAEAAVLAEQVHTKLAVELNW